MTKEEFVKIFQKFIDSLDDECRDEYYTTEAGLAERTLGKFLEWLEKQNDIQ